MMVVVVAVALVKWYQNKCKKNNSKYTHTPHNRQVTSDNERYCYLTWLFHISFSLPRSAYFSPNAYTTHTYFSPFSMNVMLFVFMHPGNQCGYSTSDGVSLYCSLSLSLSTHTHTYRVYFYSNSTSFISMVLIIVFQHESADLRTFFLLFLFSLLCSFILSIYSFSYWEHISSCKQCKITIYRINKPIIVFQTLTKPSISVYTLCTYDVVKFYNTQNLHR